jgi:hypothetical protein
MKQSVSYFSLNILDLRLKSYYPTIDLGYGYATVFICDRMGTFRISGGALNPAIKILEFKICCLSVIHGLLIQHGLQIYQNIKIALSRTN